VVARAIDGHVAGDGRAEIRRRARRVAATAEREYQEQTTGAIRRKCHFLSPQPIPATARRRRILQG
jgi:hypothetical protein